MIKNVKLAELNAKIVTDYLKDNLLNTNVCIVTIIIRKGFMKN